MGRGEAELDVVDDGDRVGRDEAELDFETDDEDESLGESVEDSSGLTLWFDINKSNIIIGRNLILPLLLLLPKIIMLLRSVNKSAS